jgi:hypothetical protein
LERAQKSHRLYTYRLHAAFRQNFLLRSHEYLTHQNAQAAEQQLLLPAYYVHDERQLIQ